MISANKQKVQQIYQEIWTNWSAENAEKLKGFMSPDFVCHVPNHDFNGFNENASFRQTHKRNGYKYF